ncbi:sensor histidine kinase, partial [Streptomyces oceani]
VQQLALALPLARRWPVAGWLLVAALALCASPRLLTLSYSPPLAVFSYFLGRRDAHSGPALLGFAALAAAGTAGAFARTPDDVREAEPGLVWVAMVGTMLVGAIFPWITGRYRRQDQALAAAGWARAEQLEREQRIVAAQARLRERARIAEDMHDALGHDLSLIALRAAALQLAPDLSAEHRESVAGLRAETAEATERLREIIGVLREPDGTDESMRLDEAAQPADPDERSTRSADGAAPLTPVDESIETLVRRSAASGLPVRLLTDAGEPEGGPSTRGAVPRAGCRVVREALTNAAKHSPGAEVTVAVDRAAGGLTVRVRNGPPEPPLAGRTAGPSRDGGTGLVALRERVRLAGGALHTSGSGDGGFQVTARFPANCGSDTGTYAGASGGATNSPRTGGGRDVDRLLAGTRAEAQRGTRCAAALAGLAMALLAAGTLGWYVHTTAEQVLSPIDYRRLKIGDSEPAVREKLPARQETNPPLDRAPARPAGGRCAYYRGSGELFTSVDIYRLCFRDGKLTGKHVIQGLGDRD